MSAAVILEIQRVQDVVKGVLLREGPKTFDQLFRLSGLRDGVRVGTVMPGRILERAIRAMRRDGCIRYNRSEMAYEIVVKETKS
jgi:hypothetical protein